MIDAAASALMMSDTFTTALTVMSCLGSARSFGGAGAHTLTVTSDQLISGFRDSDSDPVQAQRVG
jgi:hypothetical protein